MCVCVVCRCVSLPYNYVIYNSVFGFQKLCSTHTSPPPVCPSCCQWRPPPPCGLRGNQEAPQPCPPPVGMSNHW